MSKIEYKVGDAFNGSASQIAVSNHPIVLMHGCNSYGVMGSGFAKTFKRFYPSAFKKYVSDVESWDNSTVLGKISWYDTAGDYYLASAITQREYGSDGKQYVSYDAIEAAFRNVGEKFVGRKVSIHIPLIGCGLGGGKWTHVAQRIKKVMAEFPEMSVTVWELE